MSPGTRKLSVLQKISNVDGTVSGTTSNMDIMNHRRMQINTDLGVEEDRKDPIPSGRANTQSEIGLSTQQGVSVHLPDGS